MLEATERHRFVERDIDEGLVWALHCENPSLERVTELLAQGADVNAREPMIGTVLIHAVGDRRVPRQIVEFLVEHGADATAANQRGDSVLMRAMWNRRLERETVELLVLHGANVNAVNAKGDSILMQAVLDSRVSLGIVGCLVDLGADINAKNENGDSSLTRALSNGRRDIVEFLVEHGAFIDTKDEKLFFTAYLDCGPEMVAYLHSKGANPNGVLATEDESKD
jgi:uncharacterized protein